MGAWGTGLFSDDLALDVKGAYRDLVADGASADDAKAALLAQFNDVLDDPDSGPVFWLAFAATAWKLGRLDDDTKARALGIIERGDGLDLWDTPKLRRERQQVLAKTGTQIASPQAAEAKIRKPKAVVTDWKTGEVLGLKTPAGDWTLLHVVDHLVNGESRFPVCELLSWRGQTLPPSQKSIDMAATVHLLQGIKGQPMAKTQSFVLLDADTKANRPRIERIGAYRKIGKGLWGWLFHPKEPKNGVGRSYIGMGYIDGYLSGLHLPVEK